MPFEGFIFNGKRNFTYFYGGQGKIVYISVDFAHKKNDGNRNINLEDGKTEISTMIVLTNEKKLKDPKVKAQPYRNCSFRSEHHFDRYNGNDFEFGPFLLFYWHQTRHA